MSAPSDMQVTLTYDIPQANISKLMAKLEMLSRRSVKLGMPPFEIEKGTLYFKEPASGKEDDLPTPMIPLKITAQRPIIHGYRFLAKLERSPGADENLVLSMASDPIPHEYRSCAPGCDHCKTNRQRVKTFLVQHIESEEIVQVGSSCLADFTGHADPHLMAAYAELLFSIERTVDDYDDDPDLRGVERDPAHSIFEMQSILAIASAVVRNSGGYVSRRDNEHGIGTVDLVIYVIDKQRSEVIKPEDRAQAEKIMEWLKSDEVGDLSMKSDFLYNLRVLAKGGAVHVKRLGLAVAAVPAYQRHMREQLQKAQSTQEYIGKEGDRIERRVRLDHTNVIEGVRWGDKLLCHFTDEETGAKLTWFATGSVRMRKGSSYWITGTVSKHEEYRGTKQTVLQRVVATDLKPFELLNSLTLDAAKFKKAVKAMKDVDVINQYSETLLFRAAYSNCEEAVQILLDAGANPNIAQSEGVLPIVPLINCGAHNAVRLLVEHGARVDVEGETNDLGVALVNPRDYVDASDEEMMNAIGERAAATLRMA